MDDKAPTFDELIRMRVVYAVPGMDAVSVRRNLPYKSAGADPLHMDVYAPAGPPQPRPAVILVHGGPIPRIGARKMGVFVSYGELLAASGFVAVAFDHRYLAPDRLRDADADVTDLVAHVRTNAAALGIDAGRLALWAFSGGGTLLSAPLRDRPGWLRAVVAYYAVLDLQQPAAEEHSGVDDDLRRAFSAIRGLGADATGAPPILVARAGRDYPWLNATIDRFVEAAGAAGATLDLLTLPNGRHGFDILDDEARSAQVIRRTLEFLRDQLFS